MHAFCFEASQMQYNRFNESRACSIASENAPENTCIAWAPYTGTESDVELEDELAFA